jgi:2-methylcitrate dehydratase PrpD
MLGMAAGQASGLKINFGTMAKPFQAGHASRNGVVAAILASNGMTAASNAIEAPHGFCEITSNTYDKTKLNEPLGQSWEILEPHKGVIFKLYPVLGGGVGIIDSVIDLSKKFNISASDIARVVCTLREEMAASLSQGIPRTPLEGRFNIPFWVATALIEHEVTPSHFTDAQVKDPAVRDLMSKVKVQYSSRLKREDGANIAITMKDGKNYSKRTWPPKGAPDNPPSDADLYAKFRGCAKFGGVDEKEAGIIAKLVMDLETLTDIRDLTKHLT